MSAFRRANFRKVATFLLLGTSPTPTAFKLPSPILAQPLPYGTESPLLASAHHQGLQLHLRVCNVATPPVPIHAISIPQSKP